jgi:hypothetical protein
MDVYVITMLVRYLQRGNLGSNICACMKGKKSAVGMGGMVTKSGFPSI